MVARWTYLCFQQIKIVLHGIDVAMSVVLTVVVLITMWVSS